MKDSGVQFHQRIPQSDHLKLWFLKGEFLALHGLMAEGGEDKELLNLFTKHSHHQNINVLYLCQDIGFHQVNTLRVGTLSSGNVDGNGDTETCEKIGERTLL